MALSQKHIEILTKRGLDVETLVAKGWDTVKKSGTDWLTIPFVKGGSIVNHKYRTFGEDKRFHQDKDAEKCFYNFDVLDDPAYDKEPLVITEGELDAESAIVAGYPRTVSVPDGAPSAPTTSTEKFAFLFSEETDRLIPELAGIERIIVAVDNDGAGQYLYQSLLKIIGAQRIQWIKYPFRPKSDARYKDLNEVLEKHGPKGANKTLATAQWHPVDGIFKLSDLPPKERRSGIDSYFPGLGKFYRLRKGDFTVVTGIPNHGKTQFCLNLSYYMARNHQWKCLMALFETEIETEVRWHFTHLYCGERPDRITAEQRVEAEAFIDRHYRFVIPKPMEDATLEWLFEKFDAGILRFNADFALLDPWNEVDHQRPHGMNITDYTGQAIKHFKRMAHRFDVHLMVCAHPTKEIIMGGRRDKPPKPSLYDIEGSRHWYGKCDVGVVVHRDFETDITTVYVDKTRYHDLIGYPGKVELRYNKEKRDYELLGTPLEDAADDADLLED